MTKGLTRINRRRSALDTIRRLSERADNVLVVHYSCESFYDREGRGTPRITSIAVRNLASGQSESFSIHKIAENRNFDLARCLVDIYGLQYIGHPRLENLVRKNNIAAREFLSGSQEAEAFEKKQYVKLHQSTLRKVDIFANIFWRVIDGDLKTNAKWADIYGCRPEDLAEFIREHWIFSIIGFLGAVSSIVGLLIYSTTR